MLQRLTRILVRTQPYWGRFCWFLELLRTAACYLFVVPRSLRPSLACRDMRLVRITECWRLDGPIDMHEETTRLLLGLEDNVKAIALPVSLYDRNTNPFPP